MPRNGDHVFGQRAHQLRRVFRNVAPEQKPLVQRARVLMDLREEVEIDRAQPPVAATSSRVRPMPSSIGFVRANVRIGARKNFRQFAEPLADQRQAGRIARRQH